MTKVLSKALNWWLAGVCVFLGMVGGSGFCAEVPDKPAQALYLQLGSVELDPSRVYQVRGASLNRAAIQITLDDGSIAFTKDVMGRITGAFFEGDGEILLSPPNAVERRSMSLFTGMAILEERFETAYFRFNDDLFSEIRPDLRETEAKQEFVDRWNATARNLASADAMRLLVSFSRMLPSDDRSDEAANATKKGQEEQEDRYLHARLQGVSLGVFDVYFDSNAAEQIQAGQAKRAENGNTYYDVWTSFSLNSQEPETQGTADATQLKEPVNPLLIQSYVITAEIFPPKEIHATARLRYKIKASRSRTLLFELSRFLRVASVRLDGKTIEFINNPSLEGTQLSRQGNDIVAVILPEAPNIGKEIELEFDYRGEVLAEAGSGLLYVGARGTWYPNRGMEVANFDLEFRYPPGWTLVATGKQVAARESGNPSGEQVSRWISERPIPVAGFNLGKYRESTTHAADVSVETYATQTVEKDFPEPRIQVIDPHPPDRTDRRPEVIIAPRPSPARNEVTVGETAAEAIQYFTHRFGAFPYSHLALTQMPGHDSQGWPGLIFLSSYAFLNDQERQQLHIQGYALLMQHLIPAHETAHQWWGDLVQWRTYRDQWFSEGLANYCALMMLQEKDPEGFAQIMEKYRTDLITKNKDGISPQEAGPVTLGTRLLSSRFPEGYEAISYGRGTWLFHMLRTMLNDAEVQETGRIAKRNDSDELFVRGLLKLRERYQGRSISTHEMLDVFAEDLPTSLRYEGKSSLDWFLNGWINGTSLPRLELRSVKFAPRGKGLIVSGTILQNEAPEDLVTSVPIYAVTTRHQTELLGRVFADGEESTFRLSAPIGTRKILLDPYSTILTAPN